MRHNESNLQKACVTWFNLQYPQYYGLLFSSLNGLHTSSVQARMAKAEGMVAGVADLQFARARHGYHGLFIELKDGKAGKQSDAQKEWQKKVERQGYCYVVVRDIESFMNVINDYLMEGSEDDDITNIILQWK